MYVWVSSWPGEKCHCPLLPLCAQSIVHWLFRDLFMCGLSQYWILYCILRLSFGLFSFIWQHICPWVISFFCQTKSVLYDSMRCVSDPKHSLLFIKPLFGNLFWTINNSNEVHQITRLVDHASLHQSRSWLILKGTVTWNIFLLQNMLPIKATIKIAFLFFSGLVRILEILVHETRALISLLLKLSLALISLLL